MSTQLILYPQTYNGLPNATSLSPTQKLVDGINFSSINTSSSYDSASSLSSIESSVLLAAPPNIINTWYRYRSTISGTPALPTRTGSSLVLSATTTSTRSGVYQKLSNLIVGAGYAIAYQYTGGTTGAFTTTVFSGTTQTHQWTDTIPVVGYGTVYRVLFAQSVNNDTVVISFEDTAASDVTITEMTCVQTGVDPVIFGNFTAEDGQVICDLYQEEDIPLTISIDDFKNVAEQVQTYSKDFNLPATKRNNLIFNNMFEVTRADDGLIFNPYIRTQCVLKQDGFILFQGYLRMIDVQDQEGEISYNVNLYSEVIALADILKERTFSDLDFSELTHDYDKDSIKDSWSEPSTGTGLPLLTPLPTTSYAYETSNQPAYGASQTNVLKYPFIDWTHQYVISQNTAVLGSTFGNPELPSLEAAFRPCIQLRYLINKIFEQTPFTWTSNLFDSADFGKLFMDFNWGSNEFGSEPEYGTYGGVSLTPLYSTTSYQTVPLDDENFSTNIGWDNTNNRFTATNNNSSYAIQWAVSGTVLSGMGNLTVRWAQYNSAGTFLQQYDFSSSTYAVGLAVPTVAGQIDALLQSGDYLQLEFKTDVASKFVITLTGAFTYFLVTIGSLVATTNTFLQTLRGELGQWDFLKGIMTMFNLVSLADDSNPNNIRIDPYSDIFIKTTDGITLADRSIEYDWTDKVDVSQMQLTPLTDLNKMTVFKFVEDDEDYVFKQYKNSTSGHLYGSKVFDASGFTILEGTKEIIAEPFAATVSKPLSAQFANFIVPSIYAMNEDGTSEGFDNSPRILYNNGKISTGASYYIPAQNGLGSENQTFFLQFSHLSDIPTVATTPPLVTDTRDFVFESSQLFQPIGNSPTNNLFNNYWLPYYAELYNADTRLMTLKVNLTPSDINVFKMTDTVMIKNRSFRVNKIEYKPNDLATVEFILIP